MLEPDAAKLLERLFEETQAGRLKWVKDDDDWFSAEVGTNVQPILIRRMYIEATNQVGGDPYFVELKMTGWNARFAIVDDSDGWQAVARILDAAFPDGWHSDAKNALETFDLKFNPTNSDE
jgi:hypothetical protein